MPVQFSQGLARAARIAVSGPLRAAAGRADWAAALGLAGLLEDHERVDPGTQAVDRVEPHEQLGLAVDDLVASGPGDRAHEVVAVGEVVVELALGGVRTGADVVERGTGDPALGYQLGGGAGDPLARLPSPPRPRVRPRHGHGY